jgi:hypothetical protein
MTSFGIFIHREIFLGGSAKPVTPRAASFPDEKSPDEKSAFGCRDIASGALNHQEFGFAHMGKPGGKAGLPDPTPRKTLSRRVTLLLWLGS